MADASGNPAPRAPLSHIITLGHCSQLRRHALLDDVTIHVHDVIWSRNIPRDRITAISDVGQVEYKDARGYGMTVQIMWLMRAVDDDERFVLGRLQRPWREAIAKLRDWADVRDAS